MNVNKVATNSTNNTLSKEYRILTELSVTIPGVVRPLEYMPTSSSECIILEDFGGISFRQFLQQSGPFKQNVSAFLDIAIQITDTLRTTLINKNSLNRANSRAQYYSSGLKAGQSPIQFSNTYCKN